MGLTLYVIKEWFEFKGHLIGLTYDLVNMSYGGYVDLDEILKANGVEGGMDLFVVSDMGSPAVRLPIKSATELKLHNEKIIETAIDILYRAQNDKLVIPADRNIKADIKYVVGWMRFFLKCALNNWLVVKEQWG